MMQRGIFFGREIIVELIFSELDLNNLAEIALIT
jgi:hypothetical protein